MRLLLLFVIMSSFTHAQITIDDTDFPNANDTVRMSESTDIMIDFAMTGEGVTWDYSNLVASSQYQYHAFPVSQAGFLIQYTFGPSVALDYRASYFTHSNALPLDALGGALPVNIEKVNQYFKKEVDSITSVGYSIVLDGNEVPIKSDTIETYYQLPLTYGDAYSSRGYSKLDISALQAIWIQYRQRYTLVDGYGTLITPYGSFDAIRMMHHIQETDSLSYDFLGTGTPFWIELPVPETRIYEWWTVDEKAPLLRITTQNVQNQETVSAVEYKDSYQGMDLGVGEQTLNWNIYPNPLVDFVTIQSESEMSTIRILDMQGRVIQEENVHTFFIQLNTSELLTGNYLIEVHTNTGISRKTITKK